MNRKKKKRGRATFVIATRIPRDLFHWVAGEGKKQRPKALSPHQMTVIVLEQARARQVMGQQITTDKEIGQ